MPLPQPLRRSLSFLALGALAALVGAAPASASRDQYPTDRCVAQKLAAAGRYCAAAVLAAGRDEAPSARVRKALANSWAQAEAESAAAGVSCEETTVGAEEMASLLDAGAAEIAAAAGDGGTCSQRAALAATACERLLAAEAQHIAHRDKDRERRLLQRKQDAALAALENAWDGGACSGGASADEASEVVRGVVGDAFLAATVSPAVPTEWTNVDPDDTVVYGDQVLEPICSRGTPWSFWVKRGTVNKLLVYFQGGGACWNFLTCGTFFPTFKQTTGPGDNPANATTGFADLENPDNPFRDWNAVFIPYCTGDVHWGGTTFVHEHEFSDESVTIHHKGRINAAVAEKWAREHFVSPEQVFVTGSSAGSYGAVVNALFLKEDAYPSTPFAVLGDAGNGVITDDFLQNDLAKWGIEENLPRWIPGLDRPLTELSAADLWTEAARFYQDSRFANYTTAYDGGQGGQVGFYNIMLSGEDVTQWVQWWRPSCDWNERMRALVTESAAQAPGNYRYYIGTGSRHTMWGHPKVYTDTTGGVPRIVDWLVAMLQGTPDWIDVECTDCGTLLEGDPRPDPRVFTAEQRLPYVLLDEATNEQEVVCE